MLAAAPRVALLAALAASAAMAAPSLPTVTVTAGDVTVTRSFDGVLEPVEQSILAAQTMGRILAMTHDVNDPVTLGQVLVRIDDAEAQAGLRGADANLAQAKARATDAHSQRMRTEQVFTDGLVSRSELDSARAADDAAAAVLQAAEAAQRQAREQLAHATIRSPLDGIVLRRHAEAGEMASPGQPLLTVAAPSRLRLVASVPQGSSSWLRSGAKARVVLADGRVIEAESTEIFPSADASTHTFTVRAVLSRNTPGISAGMLAKLAFAAGAERQMTVPATSVVRRSEITAVYVMEPDGRVTFRQILAGDADGNGNVAVLAGLREGERVITDPVAAGNAIRGGKGAH